MDMDQLLAFAQTQIATIPNVEREMCGITTNVVFGFIGSVEGTLSLFVTEDGIQEGHKQYSKGLKIGNLRMYKEKTWFVEDNGNKTELALGKYEYSNGKLALVQQK